MSKNNDTDFIYNEAKIADGKELLSDIKHNFVDVDYLLYDAIVKITGAKGIDAVEMEDYSIDLSRPEKLMEQSRSDLKLIMDTLDTQLRSIEQFMNPQQETANNNLHGDEKNASPSLENQKREISFTKEELIGTETNLTNENNVVSSDEIKTTPSENPNSSTGNEIQVGKIESAIDKPVIYGPPSMTEPTDGIVVGEIQSDIAKPVIYGPPSMTEPTDGIVIGKIQSDIAKPVIYGPPSMMNENNPPAVEPTPQPTPVPQPVPNPTPQPEPTIANPEPVASTVKSQSVTPTAPSPQPIDTTSSETAKVSTNTISKPASTVEPTKIENTTSSNVSPINQRNGIGNSLPSGNQVKTEPVYVPSSHSNKSSINKKVVGGAIGGAALLGAIGLGVATTKANKKEKDSDENFDSTTYSSNGE